MNNSPVATFKDSLSILFYITLLRKTKHPRPEHQVLTCSFSIAAKHYAMRLMTTPLATFACLSFNLHQTSASTLAILFWLFFCPPPPFWLWAPLQFTGRAHGQQTNAGRSPPPADRKQSGRAEQRGCYRTFSAPTLRNAHAPHLSGSTGFQGR